MVACTPRRSPFDLGNAQEFASATNLTHPKGLHPFNFYRQAIFSSPIPSYIVDRRRTIVAWKRQPPSRSTNRSQDKSVLTARYCTKIPKATLFLLAHVLWYGAWARCHSGVPEEPEKTYYLRYFRFGMLTRSALSAL
jgi:hypothetical protein